MGGDVTSIDPSKFTAAGEQVAEVLERAAIPVTPPVAVAPRPRNGPVTLGTVRRKRYTGGASDVRTP